MATVAVYNQEGKRAGEMQLNDRIFGVPADEGLVHQAVVAAQANARRSIASTKTRGEVRGGGKKPWRQKGTGRARQGSTRSPLWVGGGITFGPRAERNFAIKINKKTKRKALFVTLSDKLASDKLLVLEDIKAEPAKTKIVAQLMTKLPVEKTVLLVAPKSDAALLRMVRNLPNVKLVTANSLGLIDALTYRSLVFLKDAVPVFEKIYA